MLPMFSMYVRAEAERVETPQSFVSFFISERVQRVSFKSRLPFEIIILNENMCKDCDLDK